MRSILVVCTGNVCRSPVAESHLAAGLGREGVRVSSAGLHARIGEPVDPATAQQVDPPIRGFAARQLVPEHIEAADLVLVMTRAQRRAAVSAVPAALRRTFTLREFADLAQLAHHEGRLTGSAPRNLALVVSAAPALRSRRAADRADDVDDPRGREPAAHALAVATIGGAVADVVSVVAAGRHLTHPNGPPGPVTESDRHCPAVIGAGGPTGGRP